MTNEIPKTVDQLYEEEVLATARVIMEDWLSGDKVIQSNLIRSALGAGSVYNKPEDVGYRDARIFVSALEHISQLDDDRLNQAVILLGSSIREGKNAVNQLDKLGTP